MNLSYSLIRMILMGEPDETTRLRAEFEDNYYLALAKWVGYGRYRSVCLPS